MSSRPAVTTLENNFGHGRQHLAIFLVTLNLRAFAFHTVCDLAPAAWQAGQDWIACPVLSATKPPSLAS
jgi:hypothetical protein